MEISRSFNPCDRYVFDFQKCPVSKGWAQVDTYQDASYFGVWANPFTFETMTYAEGDICHVVCDGKSEFIDEINDMQSFYGDGGDFGIDPGLLEKNIKRWEVLGFSHLI